MSLNVLEIAQAAAAEIGVSQPPNLVSSSNDFPAQLRSLMRLTARDMMRRHAWQAMTKEATFTTVATEEQISNIKTQWSDFLRIIPQTVHNRTQNRPLWGSKNPQAWQAAKGAVVTSPAEYHWRIRGNKFYILGTPTAGEDVYFEYVSRNWLQSADGSSEYEEFAADTDVPLLDDYALVLGVKWRFLRANGIEYGEAYREYQAHVEELIGSDTPQETMSITPLPVFDLSSGYVPEAGFGA